jgi:mono/diheme cytochrome c family protein
MVMSSSASVMDRIRRMAAGSIGLGLFGSVACFSEGGERPGPGGGNHTSTGGRSGSGGVDVGGFAGLPDSGSGGEAGEAPATTFVCNDAEGEPLPARRAITSPDTGGGDGGQTIVVITKAALFREFERQTCGESTCHGGADEPLLQSPDTFRVTLDSFDDRPNLGTEALERVLSSDPDTVMPPETPGGDGSTRGPDNPVRKLAERLLAWQEAGFPERFEVTVDGTPINPDLPEDPYLLPPRLAEKLTNIGSCIPRNADVLSLAEVEIEQTDAVFEFIETSEELPETLVETDLVSFDSTTLARRNVFSYAPTYTLFSDNAGKMRHVRVPLGKTIRYDAEKKDFHIPDNTRFYKTFLKKVIDEDGNVGWRKMETRLIVVRNDEQLADGKYRTRALRAAYAWDKDETMALRVKDPFRSGAPAADRLCSYVVDETMTRDPEQNPISDDVSEFCTYMTAEEMANPSSGKIRHYAIPNTDRCDQCHMGSSSHSYILGFTPWQVDRRRDGEGGVYEAPMGDELSQLARLLEYGVVSGLEPGEAKLEESQGRRTPRNDYELKAQGYMLGNCAFCHNPNGFPVVQNPVLREFDLFPSETGGIFEFSLERFSPRARAGKSQAVRFPYITPAFGDHDLGIAGEDTKLVQLPPTEPPIVDAGESALEWDQEGVFTFLAPWRSLIWRNVYTPFTYEEDGTIFIHMPRNAPGHDCRAQKIMADWMLSIPSVPKPASALARDARAVDQPVIEATNRSVTPKVLDDARALAAENVEWYRRSVTGAQCPPDDDIVDPKVILSPIESGTSRKERQTPLDDGFFSSPRVSPGISSTVSNFRDSVPDHAHWVPTDLTETPGKWVPRRSTWKDVIVTREVPVSDRLSEVIDHLQSVHLSTELRDFALEPLPLGTWSRECQSRTEVDDSPTVEELRAAPTEPFRRWMTGTVFSNDTPAIASDPVHFQSRGESVFRAICQNCHGKDADSKSPLAATILEVTGGRTRVANFIAGLFGPPTAPGAFAREEFLVDHGATPEDWMARYLLFMGLGGTEADIPRIVLDLVATSPFYGTAVTAPGASNANMLGSAEQLCFYVLAHERALLPRLGGVDERPTIRLTGDSPFVRRSAHYELWESLCTFGNEPVIRVFDPVNDSSGAAISAANPFGVYRARDETGTLLYPEDHPVGNQHGEVELGIQPGNLLPWCVLSRTQAERDGAGLDYKGGTRAPRGSIPFCPEAISTKVLGREIYKLALSPVSRDANPDVPLGNQDFSRHWMRHGAMNAGLSAYYYLRGRLTGELEASLPFNFCTQ